MRLPDVVKAGVEAEEKCKLGEKDFWWCPGRLLTIQNGGEGEAKESSAISCSPHGSLSRQWNARAMIFLLWFIAEEQTRGKAHNIVKAAFAKLAQEL